MAYKRKFSEEEMIEYVTKKARRTARKFDAFVWRKKIERDVSRGVFSLAAEKERLRHTTAEIEKLRQEREERLLQKLRRQEEERERERLRHQHYDFEDGFSDRDRPGRHVAAEAEDEISDPEEDVARDSDEFGLRKPKFFTHVYTGYDWNKYNRVHYDCENRPPEKVRGYKFEIFYPDLIDKSKTPTYAVERDGDSGETCLIRFSGGAPYEDIAFRIVNEEWELSKKKGFRSAFDNGILRLYFNLKRHCYRR